MTKSKLILPFAFACLLLTGCASNTEVKEDLALVEVEKNYSDSDLAPFAGIWESNVEEKQGEEKVTLSASFKVLNKGSFALEVRRFSILNRRDTLEENLYYLAGNITDVIPTQTGATLVLKPVTKGFEDMEIEVAIKDSIKASAKKEVELARFAGGEGKESLTLSSSMSLSIDEEDEGEAPKKVKSVKGILSMMLKNVYPEGDARVDRLNMLIGDAVFKKI